MHQVYKTRAFIFKKSDILDADRVFSVFAKDYGRIEIFAKAIRRIASKLKGGMDIFYVSDIEFVQGKHKKTLTDAVLVQKFKGIAQVPEKLRVAKKASLVLDQFLRGQQLDEKNWNLIIDFFEKLNTLAWPVANYQLAYHYFFWNFVSVLGYKPQLFKCVHCSQPLNPASMYFSDKEGGIVCQTCFLQNKNAKKITSDTVKMLRLFLNQEWDTLFKLKIEPIVLLTLKEVSDNYYQYLKAHLSYE